MRCDHSSWRNSANGEITVFESLPTPKRPPAAKYATPGKVPSPRSASVVGASPATAPLAASAAVSRSVMCVACTMHQRESACACVSSHSTGRMRVAAKQSSTSRVCSAAWIWIGAAGPASRTDLSELFRGDGAQAVRSDPEHVAMFGGTLAQPVIQVCKGGHRMHEAPLPGGGGRAAESCMRIEHRAAT